MLFRANLVRIFIFFFCLLSFQVHSQTNQIERLLERDLGKSLEIISNNEVRYCPDNTCELFRIPKAHEDFLSFVYLYLFHSSDYIYLKKSFGESSKPFRLVAVEEPQIRLSKVGYCDNDEKTPSCIIDGIKSKLNISVGVARYDLGNYCFSFESGKTQCREHK